MSWKKRKKKKEERKSVIVTNTALKFAPASSSRFFALCSSSRRSFPPHPFPRSPCPPDPALSRAHPCQTTPRARRTYRSLRCCNTMRCRRAAGQWCGASSRRGASRTSRARLYPWSISQPSSANFVGTRSSMIDSGSHCRKKSSLHRPLDDGCQRSALWEFGVRSIRPCRHCSYRGWVRESHRGGNPKS